MRKWNNWKNQDLFILCLAVLFISSGCLSRTYAVKKERPDQKIEGNRGYLFGAPGEIVEKERAPRTTYVVEVELGKPVSKEKKALDKKTANKESAAQVSIQNMQEPVVEIIQVNPAPEKDNVKTYVVRKGDTLEKIAALPEIYGNRKKWHKIYKANEDRLKGPDKIYPGQVLQIPD